MELNALVTMTNIASEMSKEELDVIARNAIKGFNKDFQSCEDHFKQLAEWTDLAKQVSDEKTFPWQGASNVKYPLLSTAAMQFAARAYPSLLPSSGKIVKSVVIGKDPTERKSQIAEAVSIYMSYQLLNEMEGWEEDMDKLLIMLPIVGTLFKKTYYDPMTEKNCSKLVYTENLVCDYWTTSLDTAERISECFELSKRKVTERVRSGLWVKVDLGDPSGDETGDVDETTPYKFIEQHTFLDLDDDGYAEPYIVTVNLDSEQVVRITARFDPDNIVFKDIDGKQQLAYIKPTQYYTKYGFVPNPDGGFYDIGFGQLLGPLNESVNTLINQLIDSGTLNNLQSGFLGKGLKIRGGDHGFTPGEWKHVPVSGDDLRKQIVPLPSKEPSNVLYQLMGALITSGKELASVAEIFVGKMPGQNTPATTTMASIEQGMKVFTAVYKRIYRSLGEEFQKLYKLNSLYLDESKFVSVLDITVDKSFFDKKQNDIAPAADPTAASAQEKLMKAQGLLELLGTGVLDPVEVVRRIINAQEQPDPEKLFSQAVQQTGQLQPQPDPKLIEMEMKSKMEQQKFALQAQNDSRKAELEGREREAQLAMKAQEHSLDMQHQAQMSNIKAAEAIHKQRIFTVQQQQKMQPQKTSQKKEPSKK
jgi:chaperonin GroES